VKESHGG
jgi:hypothetical protein